jgi:hypothetical protein
MSLINQPVHLDSNFNKQIDFYFNSTAGNINQVLALGGMDISTRIASYTTDRITILQPGWYRVELNSKFKMTIGDNDTTFSQFRLEVGSEIPAKFESQSTLTTVGFKSQLYWNFGQTALAGQLPVRGGWPGSMNGECRLFYTGRHYLTAGQTVLLNLNATAPNAETRQVAMSGEITLELIS